MKKVVFISLAALVFFLLTGTKKAFASIVSNQRLRACDPLGCGKFGASRGDRTHQGVDVVTAVGQSIMSPISGIVTRFPVPYSDDARYRGIEIKGSLYTVKIFYVTPLVNVGQSVKSGEKIGIAQDLIAKYGSQITNHVHLEVRETQTGKLINPENLF